jgi:hypothetical protein
MTINQTPSATTSHRIQMPLQLLPTIHHSPSYSCLNSEFKESQKVFSPEHRIDKNWRSSIYTELASGEITQKMIANAEETLLKKALFGVNDTSRFTADLQNQIMAVPHSPAECG